MLWLLLRNVGNPVSDGDIYRELYGGKGPTDSRASEQAVRRLRRKLGPLGASIERQRGVVDPGSGAFSHDLEKPVCKVFVSVDDDSDEPFAVRSVTVEP